MSTTTPIWDDAGVSRARLAQAIETEVCVIGAGVAGLSTAWHLARRGIGCTVVEMATVASGASGRNGGFLVPGGAVGHADAHARYGGRIARRTRQATHEALATIRELHGEAGIATELEETGFLSVSWAAGEVEQMRSDRAAMDADGFRTDWLDERDLPELVRRPGRVGLLEPDGATTHPGRWIRAFAGLCERAGVRIFEHSPVAEPLDGRSFAAGAGHVRAERVVVATDGALAQLVPSLAHLLRSKRLHIVGTEPAPAGTIPVPMAYRGGYEYVQQRPDGRVVIGGFSDHDGPDGAASFTTHETVNPAVHALIERHLREDLGVTAAVTHRWIGMVGYSHDSRPVAGAVPGCDGLYAAGGYNGSGALNGFVAGRVVAELIADGSSADADLYDSTRA